MNRRHAFSALFFATAVGCATDAHQNFKNIMSLALGKSADGRYEFRNQYRDRLIGVRDLGNGNIEEEFELNGRKSPNLKCLVYFEIDQAAQKIVSWRFEEREKGFCKVVP